MIWTKGTVDILGGVFIDNHADNTGGVIMAGEESTTRLTGGEYQGNRASDGGVVYVRSGAELFVSGDTFSENKASNFGGAFFVGEDGILKVGKTCADLMVVAECGVFHVMSVLLLWGPTTVCTRGVI